MLCYVMPMLPFRGLSVSVCLSVKFVYCAQTAEDFDNIYLFLLHTTAPWLSQIVLKFDLHQQPFPPQLLPQRDPPPVDLSFGDIRRQIAAEWLERAQWSQWSQ